MTGLARRAKGRGPQATANPQSHVGEPSRGLWLRFGATAPYLIAVVVLFGELTVRAVGSLGWVDAVEGVLNRATSIVTSPLYGGAARPGQQEIVIVALDDEFRRAQGGGWPPSYAATGQVLRRVLATEPKAVFLDFYFQDAHLADGWPDEAGARSLAGTLRAHALGGGNRPVLTGPVVGKDWPLPLIARSASQVGLTPNDERLFAYSTKDDQGRPMAASALYEVWLGQRPPPLPKTLSLDWGFGVSPWTAARLPPDHKFCIANGAATRAARTLQLAWRVVAPNLNRDDPVVHGMEVDCPYFDIIPAERLLTGGAMKSLGAHLKGRIVLIGATSPWLGDHTAAPLLGDVPGVMVHAMALDNLIQNQGRATRYPKRHEGLLGLDDSELLRFILLSAGFFAIWAWRRRLGLTANQSLSLGAKLTVWGGIGGLSLLIAWLCHWPLFKLWLAAAVGGICLEAWDRLVEHRSAHRTVQEGVS